MTRHPGINPPPFVTKIEAIEGENVHLESSYCYPRGGGQPGDTGNIESERGESTGFGEVLPGEMLLHPVENPDLFEIGASVTCSIDIERRNGHALMHTAQHIVSALAEDMWGPKLLATNLQ